LALMVYDASVLSLPAGFQTLDPSGAMAHLRSGNGNC
jgi:hypothetical protein